MADLTRTNHFVNGEVADGDAVENEFDLFLSNINERIHVDGTNSLEGDLTILKHSPAVILDGIEGSGDKWRIREHVVGGASYLAMETYDTVGVAWVTILDLPDDPTTLQTLVDDVRATHLQIENDNPAVRFSGTEVDGNEAKIEEDKGELVFSVSIDGGSSWTECFRIGHPAYIETTGNVNCVCMNAEMSLFSGNDCIITDELSVGHLATNDCVGFAQLKLVALEPSVLVSGTGDKDWNDEAMYPLVGNTGLVLPENVVPIVFASVHLVDGIGTPIVTAVPSVDQNEHTRIRYAVINTGGHAWSFHMNIYALWTGVKGT